MRADAQRNRDLIIQAARQVFRESGYDASLDRIAKVAGVGPGTLYRHFATREDLMDAVMAAWVERVEDATDKALVAEGGPRGILLAWLEAYVALVSMHKGGAAKITAALGNDESPMKHKCTVLQDASARVLTRLADDDAVRSDVTPLQVARIAGGVAAVADNADLEAAAVRPMLEVVADGLLR